tara:strand:- start:1205 stop:2050 length:846 start_codon:yes stop_codon:yes gene_type:complete
MYFTDLPEYAGEYTRGRHFGASVEPLEGGNIIPAYVSMKNPLVINKSHWEHGRSYHDSSGVFHTIKDPVFAEIEGIVQRNMADPDYLKSLSPDRRAAIDEFMVRLDKGEVFAGRFPNDRLVRRNDPGLPMVESNPYRGFAITDYAKSRGHDGVIIKDAGQYDDYTLYDAHQAKLKKDLADVEAAWQDRQKLTRRGPPSQQDLDELARMKREVKDASDDLAEEIGADFPEHKPFVEYLVFEPTQIKSKFNRGTFDPTDPRILYGAGLPPAAILKSQLRKDED